MNLDAYLHINKTCAGDGGPDLCLIAFWLMILMQFLNNSLSRFWVALRFQQLLFHRKFARAASFEELIVNSRLFVWAYHSDSVENLFGSVIPSEPSWQEMRALGVGFWYASIPQMRARVMLDPFVFSTLLHVQYVYLLGNSLAI